MKIDFKVLIASLIIVFLVAFIGSIFTSGNTDSEWYQSVKSKLTPPNFIFPIVWNILFFLITLSLYFAWIQNKQRKKVAFVFGLNFILNILWSLLFFQLKNPFYAFIELIILWISIVYMIFITGKIDKKAAWLLVPYLLWVSFASILNFLAI